MSDDKPYAQSLEAVQVFKRSLEQIGKVIEQIGQAMAELQGQLDDTKLVERTNSIKKKIGSLKVDTDSMTEWMSEERVDELNDMVDRFSEGTSRFDDLKKVFYDFGHDITSLGKYLQHLREIDDKLEGLEENEDFWDLLEDKNQLVESVKEKLEILDSKIDDFVKLFSENASKIQALQEAIGNVTDGFKQQENLLAQLGQMDVRLQEHTALVQEKLWQKREITELSSHIEQQHIVIQEKISQDVEQLREKMTADICLTFKGMLEGQRYAQQVEMIRNILADEHVPEEESGVAKLFKNSYEERYRELRRIVDAIRSVVAK